MWDDKMVNMDILRNIPLYISLLDLNLNIKWANDEAIKSGSFEIKKKCYDGFNPDMEQCTFCPVVRSIASGNKEFSFIEVFDQETSAKKIYEITAVPVKNENDQLVGIYEIRKDVTCQLKTPDNNKHKKTKEEPFSSEDLLDIVSGEIKEHLIQALKMHHKIHGQKFNQEEKIGLAGIRTSLSKIENVINNIVTIRNINKGIVKQNIKKMDLKKVVTETLLPYENKVDFNSNSFDYKYDSNLPTQLVFDQMIVGLILTNLLDYIMSHTSNRSIYLQSSLIDSTNDHVLVSFKLEGVGSINIHDEVKKDASAYLKNNLTLAVINHLVKSQGGEFKITPQGGYGVNLEVLLTLKKAFVKSKLPFFNKNKGRKNLKKSSIALFETRYRKKILIAEDDPISRITIEEILNKDFDIILAKNGKIAVEKYFEEAPDLVIMDIMMPVMNGFDAYDEIQHNTLKEVPIIACTSKVIRSEKEYLMSYGFDDYIAKPINVTTLTNMIKKHI